MKRCKNRRSDLQEMVDKGNRKQLYHFLAGIFDVEICIWAAKNAMLGLQVKDKFCLQKVQIQGP